MKGNDHYRAIILHNTLCIQTNVLLPMRGECGRNSDNRLHTALPCQLSSFPPFALLGFRRAELTTTEFVAATCSAGLLPSRSCLEMVLGDPLFLVSART